MPEIINRGTWDPGDTARFSRPLLSDRVRGLVLHYPGTGSTPYGVASAAEIGAKLRGFKVYHRRVRGWPDIGYLSAIDQAGRFYWCAGHVVGAHSATGAYPAANHERWGNVLMLGNHEQPTPAMIDTVKWLRHALRDGRLGRAYPRARELWGHQMVPGASTSCPGEATMRLIRSGAFMGEPDGTPDGDPRTEDSHAQRKYGAGEVEAIQRKLKAAGYDPGPADGDYGPRTAAAVIDYQAGQRYPRLYPDGDWGPVTDRHHGWVRELQAALNLWKSDLPDLREDGDYGDLTWRRVKEWQRRNHGGAYPRTALVDGKAGPITCGALGVPVHP